MNKFESEAYKIACTAGKTVGNIVTFNQTDDFKAYHAAVNFAKDLKLAHGSMAREMPIALAPENKFRYIAKWYKIDTKEYKHLAGVILGEDKRNGPVAVALFD